MKFCITDHIDFDSKGRAICPSCATQGKTRSKNLALVPNTDGAYKCHRGCSPAEIREALGTPKEKVIPQALAQPERERENVTVTPKTIADAHQKLMKGKQAKQWLLDRGFTLEMIEHYKLGVA
ncbi:MAG TPA: hypothetical protein V6C65_15690, partial [Allocoleopsis sp.]